ncbi:hypothetical protein QQP08_020661 [Theobroma cacao]|nr:hypothetical protein QQP08_020661 [Theobroma cacao]
MGIPLQSSNISSALATFRMLEEPIYNLPDTISMTNILIISQHDDLPADVIQKLPKGSTDIAVDQKSFHQFLDAIKYTNSHILKVMQVFSTFPLSVKLFKA